MASQSESPTPSRAGLAGLLFELLLIALLAAGIMARFNWVNWSQDANLHPDEYGLTNTLTQLRMPDSLGDYFNTRISPLSPYPRYDIEGIKTADGPDNRLRWGQWPIVLLRAAAEATGATGYNELRLMGRTLSALADTLVVLLILLIGQRLFGERAGLLAAALSALAVLQIQQAHFMTVDTFAAVFVLLAMYAAVRAAGSPPLARDERGVYRWSGRAWGWYALFGLSFGMAVASRVNLVPLAGMILIAAFLAIADLKLRERKELGRIFLAAGLHLALAGLLALIAFRAAQPMTFRAETGDTGFFTLHPNPDWVESMKVAQSESNGIGGGPPGEQWAHRTPILFPLTNMVLWGMGLPLGIAAWAGFLWALVRTARGRPDWKLHLLPLVWVGGYFLFMGTRWVKSMRYFLPIYPFLCLFAAWALLELWRRARAKPGGARLLAGLGLAVVLAGTAAWAGMFIRAVYLTDHTRVQATRWILHNVPAPFMLELETQDGLYREPLPAPDFLVLTSIDTYPVSFTLPADGKLTAVEISRARPLEGINGALILRISRDPFGTDVLAEAQVAVPLPGADERGSPIRAEFPATLLAEQETYYLVAAAPFGSVQVTRTVIANENWDEGLPFPFENRDPFGGLYRGITNEVRWADNADKKQMFLEVLAQADYLVLPSQRAIWSVPRIPKTYPMTMAYYRALFDGSLGFEPAAAFQTPLQLGPLSISDVGGTLAWGRPPDLPLFNLSPLAAEEAFSVYDHPPVWIFKKRADFNIEQAAAVLNSVDLSTVVVQGPRDATWDR